MRMRLPLGLMAAAVVALVAAASAQAAASQSMVYVANGNVFIANADGSNPHQVTANGKATTGAPLSDPASDSAAYHSPTEAADGTIWAPNGFALYHLNQNGTLIKEVVPPGGEYALAAAVAPDDSKVAYNWDIPAVGSGGALGGQTGSSVITAAGAASSYPDGTRTEDGSWLSDSSTVILGTDQTGGTGTSTTDVDYQAPGQSPVTWFDPTDPLGASRGFSSETFFSNQPVVDPTGTYMAVVEKSSFSNNATAPQLQIYKLNGGPPAAPTLVCDYNSTDAYGFLNPAWTGDGSELAWYDSVGEQLLDTTAITSCPATPTVRTLTGVSQASFGPAPNAPAPLPPTTSPTPPAKTGPAKTAPASTFSAASLSIGKSLKKAVLLKTGVKTTLRCNAACGYAVALGVNNAAARKLGLTKKKKGPVAVGAKTGRFAGGRLTVTVKLYAKALRALRRSRLSQLSLIVAVAAKGADGKRIDHTYGVTIRR
jgi:hypothetical protein